jgi:plastocyanin
MIRALLVLPAGALVLGFALAASAPAGITIDGMKFAPATVTVQRGDSVTWTNKDAVPHTATAAGKFDSGNIAPGKSFTRRMEQPGQFDYVCTYHPGMKGQVVVK